VTVIIYGRLPYNQLRVNMRTVVPETSPRFEFRIPQDLKKEIEEAAALSGASLTAFAIQALVERAREIKRQHGLTILCDEARDSFAEMMANPPAPSEALKKTLNTRKVTL